MKTELSNKDYELLLEAIEALHRCRKIEDFPQCILAEVRKLVATTMASYTEFDRTRDRLIAILDPPRQLDHLIAQSKSVEHEHPVLNYFKTTGDGQAVKISDFLTTRDYHRMDVYRKVFQPARTEDQICFGVRVESGLLILIGLDRAERSFKERDRMILNLIRPHIIQAYVHLEEVAGYKALQRDLQAALRESGLGVIILDETDKIVHSTPQVLEALAGYIPVPESNPPKLPSSLLRWARQSDGPETFDASRESARLTVRRIFQKNRLLLLLSEENKAVDRKKLARYRLTQRESEVLHWLAEGKANSEIAIILGVAVGTVKQHMVQIFKKLGVENRTAAAQMLRTGGSR